MISANRALLKALPAFDKEDSCTGCMFYQPFEENKCASSLLDAELPCRVPTGDMIWVVDKE